MKNLDIGANLLKLFVGPLTVGCLIFHFYFHQKLLTLLSGSYYFLLAIACIALSEFGQIKLRAPQTPSTSPPPINTVNWLLGLIGGQILLAFLLFTFNQVIFYYTPVELNHEIQHTPLMAQLLDTVLKHWGLFPWSLYTLLALSYGYFVYHRQRTGSLSSTLRNQFQSELLDLVAPSIDFLARASTIAGIAIVVCFGILAILPLLNASLDLTRYHPFIFRTLLISFLCFWFLISPVSQRIVKYYCQKHYPLGIILSLYAVFILAILFLGSIISSYLAYGLAIATTHEQTHSLIHRAWLDSWLITNWAWLCLWTPLMATYIARLSRGRSLRAMVAANLLVPISLTLAWYSDSYHPLMQQTIEQFNLLVLPWLQRPVGMALMGGLSILCVCLCFMKTTDFARLDYGAFNLNQRKSLRRPLRTIPQILRFIGGFMAIFLVAWLLVLPVILLIIDTAVFVPLNLSWIALYFALSEHRELRQQLKVRKQSRSHVINRFMNKKKRKGLRSF